jgi:hypothetical protein
MEGLKENARCGPPPLVLGLAATSNVLDQVLLAQGLGGRFRGRHHHCTGAPLGAEPAAGGRRGQVVPGGAALRRRVHYATVHRHKNDADQLRRRWLGLRG